MRHAPSLDASQSVPGSQWAAARYMVMTGVLVGGAGAAGRLLTWPLLTSTVGPTAYVFAAHPSSESAKFRTAVTGHTVGVGVGLASPAAFGLLHHPSVTATGTPTLPQALASAVAVGVTVAVLELIGSHHAPSAATALLITTGLAKPGAPLIDLIVGLALVLVCGPLLGRIPFACGAADIDGPDVSRPHTGHTSTRRPEPAAVGSGTVRADGRQPSWSQDA